MALLSEKNTSVNFEELVQEYLGPVFGFLLTLVRDRDLADDLTQETFLRAWRKRSSLNMSGNVKAWLFTVAKNVAFDYFKKRKDIPFVFFETASGTNLLDNIPDESLLPDELVMRLEDRALFEEVLSKLSLRSQTLLILIYREEFSLHEIATLFETPYNTVKSQHRRALQELRKATEGLDAPGYHDKS